MGRLAILMLVLPVAACATSARGTGGSRDVITEEQIRSVSVSSAYELIQRLRPEMLQGRGRTSVSDPTAPYPVVYVNGVRARGFDELRSIAATDVQEIRYINAADATTRYGTGHTSGVIEVRLRS